MEVRISTKPMPCRCEVYDFPHRTGGGDCRMNEPFNPDADGETFDRHDTHVFGLGSTLSWQDMGMGAGR